MDKYKEAHDKIVKLRQLCNELGIPLITASRTTDGSGDIHKVRSLKLLFYSDIAYVDGVCVKHRYIHDISTIPNLIENYDGQAKTL